MTTFELQGHRGARGLKPENTLPSFEVALDCGVTSLETDVHLTRDGVPASDGTAPNADGVLKIGDGGVLDWILDRKPVPGIPGLSAFLVPIADRWRDLPIRAIAAKPGPVRSSCGVEMLAHKFGSPNAITTLLIAGGTGVENAAHDKCTVSFVQAVAKRGVRVASVCSGTFVLAEAGLLDGKRATTHWNRTRQFLATYPQIKLEPDQIFVRDGNIWSSAGITAGIDLALAMIAEDYGDEIAQKTAESDEATVAALQKTAEAAQEGLRAVTQLESYLKITAPFDGQVTTRYVHPGALVGPAGGGRG